MKFAIVVPVGLGQKNINLSYKLDTTSAPLPVGGRRIGDTVVHLLDSFSNFSVLGNGSERVRLEEALGIVEVGWDCISLGAKSLTCGSRLTKEGECDDRNGAINLDWYSGMDLSDQTERDLKIYRDAYIF